ncbi:MAG: hypothetical protein HRU76_10545 [Phycisphaeraceae bacterium]|nr:hypothetical protein [Phycisphaerales bacterium]QOJ17998.1 MAG: hypothetical protein HRU76_10545 [Phycisphaeraceae bacterium]
MDAREHVWTLILALLLGSLVWLWAEGENRAKQPMVVDVEFVVPSGRDRFLVRAVSPLDGGVLVHSISVRLELEGPNLGLSRVISRVAGTTLRVPVEDPGGNRQRVIRLDRAIEELPTLREFGVTVASVDPLEVAVEIDEIIRRTVRIGTSVPGVEFDQIQVTPDRLDIALPQDEWDWLLRDVGDQFIMLDLPPSRLRDLAPGEMVTLRDIPLRMDDRLVRRGSLNVDLPRVTAELRIARRQVERAFPVPIKLNLPIRDIGRYNVTVLDLDAGDLLQNVLITGDDTRIRQLENREIAVFAVINLTSEDLERGITSKRIEWWLPPGLTARMADEAAPVVSLQISPRGPEQP